MHTAPPDPGLAVDPPAAACPHCGAGCGGVADPTGMICAMLTELAGLNMRMVRLATEQAEAAGHLGHEQMVVQEIASRTLRRTLALTKRIYDDSRKTPEQRAAELAQRAEAAERARLRDKKEKVQLSTEAFVKRESGRSDREDLLGDLRERLLYPDMETALRREDVGTIVMRVLKDLRLASKSDTWSEALMAYEISAANAEMTRMEAEREAGQAAAAAGVDWREGVEFTPAPGVVTKRGRFTFGADGAVVAEEPPDTPQSAWPPGIVSGRDPPDTG
jgi:hypothetical protein